MLDYLAQFSGRLSDTSKAVLTFVGTFFAASAALIGVYVTHLITNADFGSLHMNLSKRVLGGRWYSARKSTWKRQKRSLQALE